MLEQSSPYALSTCHRPKKCEKEWESQRPSHNPATDQFDTALLTRTILIPRFSEFVATAAELQEPADGGCNGRGAWPDTQRLVSDDIGGTTNS
jgi:hypothetical protein